MAAPPPEASAGPATPWRDACLAAAVLALDPAWLGGLRLRAHPGPVLDRWLALLSALLPDDAALRRLPPGIDEGRLLGGIDLPASLSAGRPVHRPGLLSECDGGVILAPMAERMPAPQAAMLAAALDEGVIHVEREGWSAVAPARLALVAVDEATGEDAPLCAAIDSRLALSLDLRTIPAGETIGSRLPERDELAAARRRMAAVALGDAALAGLATIAAALGIASVRAPLLAARVARAVAALRGGDIVEEQDVEAAVRLSLLPRALAWPAEEAAEDASPPPPPEAGEADEAQRPADDRPMADRVIASVASTLPADILERLAAGLIMKRAQDRSGRKGEARRALRAGRPAGVSQDRRSGARIALIDTLKAAAPWQRLRREGWSSPQEPPRVIVRPDDLRRRRLVRRARTTTVFAVDASGSSALHRLGEAKGAVETLLAACYVRRDEVALIAFRGRSAELLLPPTRSLTRARRALAVLPGGGGTPLAAAIALAEAVAGQVARRGDRPVVVLLTDGQANVALDGSGGRQVASAEAEEAARRFAQAGHAALVIDSSPRPGEASRKLAAALGSRYLALPRADQQAIAQAVSSLSRS
jgi:magnesium chelatase subunit D